MLTRTHRIFLAPAFALLLWWGFTPGAPALRAAQPAPAQNVIVVTIDGLRWQEFFGGAQAAYFKKDSKGQPTALERRLTDGDGARRRERLLPFVWTTVAKAGQVFGDPGAGSRAHVTNGLWFSYPGYNEMFAGAPDPRVDSNDKVPNPNVTVLEWLNHRPRFAGHVAAFGAWDVLPFILNAPRSGIPVGTGFTPVPAASTTRERDINTLARDLPSFWSYGTLDAPMVYGAIEAMRTSAPRVVYVMLGEGDEWAHEGHYDLYLDATSRADVFIERLWTTAQSLDAYRGTTALLVTTDHGRGDTVATWSDHGRDVPSAENTWFAALGPGVPPLGNRGGVTVTTSQLAATIAALLGENFRTASPGAAPPLPLTAGRVP
jgi:hypothetical protein